jgi:hypothetical protein
MHISYPFRAGEGAQDRAAEPPPRSALVAAAILAAVFAAVVSLMAASHGVPPDCGDGAAACMTDVAAG